MGCYGESCAIKGKDRQLGPFNKNGMEKSRDWGRWLGRRYGPFGNGMWILHVSQ